MRRIEIEKADRVSTEDIPIPKKRGAPIGHKGANRPTKEPENIKEVIADHCEKCNSTNIEKLEKCETSIIEDMPPGIFILVYIVMLKFFLRGVIRKIQDFVLHANNEDITSKN